MSKVYGIIPARMNAYRFPGKPLALINDIPMLQWVYEGADKYNGWDNLIVATCDQEIFSFCENMAWPIMWTDPDCPRAMDRVAEAAQALGVKRDDIVVNIQGDEPMITPDLIKAVIDPIADETTGTTKTVLALPIKTLEEFISPDIVKLVHDVNGRVLYTSRMPIPYCTDGVPDIAKRIGGVFGFTGQSLEWFSKQKQPDLEILESCDSNRICGNGGRQHAAIVPWRPYYSVDRPSDILIVEKALREVTDTVEV